MGWTVLYIAFGVVALWLLGEVLMQYKARLRWRLLAFAGFLCVVVGAVIPSVIVIGLGIAAFATGQTFVTLSYRRGFQTGWALSSIPGKGGGRRRGAGAYPEGQPVGAQEPELNSPQGYDSGGPDTLGFPAAAAPGAAMAGAAAGAADQQSAPQNGFGPDAGPDGFGQDAFANAAFANDPFGNDPLANGAPGNGTLGNDAFANNGFGQDGFGQEAFAGQQQEPPVYQPGPVPVDETSPYGIYGLNSEAAGQQAQPQGAPAGGPGIFDGAQYAGGHGFEGQQYAAYPDPYAGYDGGAGYPAYGGQAPYDPYGGGMGFDPQAAATGQAPYGDPGFDPGMNGYGVGGYGPGGYDGAQAYGTDGHGVGYGGYPDYGDYGDEFDAFGQRPPYAQQGQGMQDPGMQDGAWVPPQRDPYGQPQGDPLTDPLYQGQPQPQQQYAQQPYPQGYEGYYYDDQRGGY